MNKTMMSNVVDERNHLAFSDVWKREVFYTCVTIVKDMRYFYGKFYKIIIIFNIGVIITVEQ
jgi:hypothetical protein